MQAVQLLHPLISASNIRISELQAKQTALEAYLAKVSEFDNLQGQRTAAVREQERLASKPEGSNYNIDASVRSGVLSTKITDLTERMEALKG